MESHGKQYTVRVDRFLAMAAMAFPVAFPHGKMDPNFCTSTRDTLEIQGESSEKSMPSMVNRQFAMGNGWKWPMKI